MENVYKGYNDQKITFDSIKDGLRQSLYISTIRDLRYISKMGLKEAKDKIDAACAIRATDGSITLDYEKGVKFFEQYFKTEESNLKKAMGCAIDNWEVMGFSSAVQACQTILNNFNVKD